MRGEFRSVWSQTWPDIWEPLYQPLELSSSNESMDSGGDLAFHDDLFCELFREINAALINPLDSGTKLADLLDSPEASFLAFKELKFEDFYSDRAICAFFERAYTAILELSNGDMLGEKFSSLTGAFIKRYNLRYRFHTPFVLIPTISGVIDGVNCEIEEFALQHEDLRALYADYIEAFEDAHLKQSSGRIKTCIQKQVNLLEGYGAFSFGGKGATLSDFISNVDSWPHPTIPNAINSLYGFASDVQGIRHGKKNKRPVRDFSLKDLMAITIMFSGATLYLFKELSPLQAYYGSQERSP